MEATEPMEESLALATTSLAKRKAESDPADDIEESGDEEYEYVDSEDENEEPVDEAMAFALALLAKRKTVAEESGYEVDESGDDKEESGVEYSYSGDMLVIKSKWWLEPEWDVDSFNGLEYDSSEEEDEMSNEEDELKWRRVKRQLIESKGFYVDPELMPTHNYSPIKAVADLEWSAGLGQTYRVECGVCGSGARGAFTAGPKSKSYITFMAREKPDGPLVEYQCKAWSTFVRHENYPILCRPAPTTKLSNQN
ncbi:Cystatin-related plant [Arabidopsis thaliana x Arabidopsis arenosa]|uniref:Cystatin-related plant n=1 Tax=Arabidopsis thaliana x Arabidopsis arenosa TaxID=1240361 RepID=A0A8T2AQ75_9BRAS|nr:Cystatin-related plant [Arabidopsis thaliana x Arabidopsis arenosa]